MTKIRLAHVQEFTDLSFPKIISGRIDDVVRQKLGLLQYHRYA